MDTQAIEAFVLEKKIIFTLVKLVKNTQREKILRQSWRTCV